jgi:hypothetical protein
MGSSSRRCMPAIPALRCRQKRRWLPPILLAMLTLVLLAPTASFGAETEGADNSPAVSDGEVLPIEVSAYTKEFGVQEKVALERLETQHAGIGIVRRLESVLGANYAGVWFDNQSGQFVVPSLSEDAAKMATDSLNRAHLGGQFRTTDADYSWSELQRVQEQLDKALSDQLDNRTVSTSIDPQTNAIIVWEAQGADRRQVEQAAEQQLATIEVRPVSANQFSAQPTVSCTQKGEEKVCNRPPRGGVYITVAGVGFGTSYCTAGFKAIGKEFANRFMLTAGHCYLASKDWTSLDSERFSHYLGQISESAAYYPGHDYAAIRVNGFGNWWEEGPTWNSTTVSWASGGGFTELPVTYESSSYLGQSVCHSGATAGSSCGFVKRIDLTETYGGEHPGTLFHLTEAAGAELCTLPGDSGGPVFTSTTAIGIMSGALTEKTCGGNLMLYTEVTEDASLLNVTVGTPAGARPFVETLNITEPIAAHEAIANSKVDANGLATTYRFDYGPTTSYGQSTGNISAGSGFGTIFKNASLTGLNANTVYHYRVSATNSAGTENGKDGVFTTAKVPPTVATKPPTNIGSETATFNGTVNPENLETTYYFKYGPTTSYGSTTEKLKLTGSTTQSVSKAVSLTFGTTTHYKIVATNEMGTSEGADEYFTPGWRFVSNPKLENTQADHLADISCLSATECMAVGGSTATSSVEEPNAEWWNGSSWELRPPVVPGTASLSQLEGVSCTSATNCLAVGVLRDKATGHYLPMAQKWNGTTWELIGGTKSQGSRSYLYNVSCTSATSCMAVGNYLTEEPEVSATFAEYWNGSTWENRLPVNPVKSGGEPSRESNYLESVSCVSSTDCTAVGSHFSSVALVTHYEALAEHWNGSVWEVETTPAVPGRSDSWFEGVSCTASTACTAAGYASVGHSSESIPQSLAMRWNGSSWSIQTTPNTEGGGATYLNDVSCSSATSCLAIGNGIALRWNGTTWDWQVLPFPSGAHLFTPKAISCTSSTSCVAAGFFQNATSYLGSLSETFQKVLPPNATTLSAGSVTETGATLSGTVNPNGSETKYYWEYGPTTAYGSKTPEESAGSGSSTVEKSKSVTGLTGGTTYHFRMVAVNSGGTSRGSDKTFGTTTNTGAQLAAMAVLDPFNGKAAAGSNFFSTDWTALGWAGGSTPKGEDYVEGWGPSELFPTVDGASFKTSYSDSGSGDASVATMSVSPGVEGRYVGAWLNMPTPGTTAAGYELWFLWTKENTYSVGLSKWVGGTQTVLAEKKEVNFPEGSSFAVVDKGSAVSAWTNTGSGFAQLLSAADSTYSSGYVGVQGAGWNTRLTNFKAGGL